MAPNAAPKWQSRTFSFNGTIRAMGRKWGPPDRFVSVCFWPRVGLYVSAGVHKLVAVAAQDFRFACPGESGQRNRLRGPGYFGNDTGLGNFTCPPLVAGVRNFRWRPANLAASARWHAPEQSRNRQLRSRY
jgi:hypothetical protein